MATAILPIKQYLASLPGNLRNYAKLFGITNIGAVIDVLDINSGAAALGPRKCTFFAFDPPWTSDTDPTPKQGPTLHYNWTNAGAMPPALFCPVPAYTGNATPDPPVWDADQVGPATRVCGIVPLGTLHEVHVEGRWLHLQASGGGIVVMVMLPEIFIT